MSWDDKNWKGAAREYHHARGDRRAVVEIESDRLGRLRRLLADNVSFERAYAELNSTPGRAAASTVEALMYSLRERGTAALEEPDTKRRLSQCSDAQVIEVGDRLQRLKPHIGRGPWSADEVRQLIRARQC